MSILLPSIPAQAEVSRLFSMIAFSIFYNLEHPLLPNHTSHILQQSLYQFFLALIFLSPSTFQPKHYTPNLHYLFPKHFQTIIFFVSAKHLVAQSPSSHVVVN